jgi:hypothetical protein
MAIKILIFKCELMDFILWGELGAWDGFLVGLVLKNWWWWQWAFFGTLVKAANTWVDESCGGGLVNL